MNYEDISAFGGHLGDNSALQRHLYIIRVFIRSVGTLCPVHITGDTSSQRGALQGRDTNVCAFLSMLTSK